VERGGIFSPQIAQIIQTDAQKRVKFNLLPGTTGHKREYSIEEILIYSFLPINQYMNDKVSKEGCK
jgi:hypothetical protein